jgi:hypothetical protein
MSTAALAPAVVPAPPAAPAKPAKTWLVGPLFDSLLVANLTWPAVVLLALVGPGAFVDGPLTALQVYFLSTPHRWITLVLVFFDRDRFWAQPWKFGGLAVGLIGLGLALVALGAAWPRAAHSLVLLMMLDYVWNAWHFAAQHAGIARIYGRATRPEQSLKAASFEKMAIRTLVLWTFFRTAVASARHSPYVDLSGMPGLFTALEWLDPLVLVAPLVLLARELGTYRPECRGRVLYIGSVVAMYAAQVLAIRAEQYALTAALFLGAAIFHATEYLAVCAWSVRKKTTGVWRYTAPRLGLAVLAFMVVMMISNMLIMSASWYAWALMTLLVSLLHYAYDGIIWRAKPAAKPAPVG